MRQTSKNEDIEALRAIAVALVVLCHAGELFRPPGAFNALLNYVDFWGGVDIFFCVSGFVIAGSLLRKDNPSSFRALAVPFYVRRIFRIWPAAFLWLAVAVAAAKVENTSGAFGPFRADFREAIAAVLQVHNIYLGLCHAGTLALQAAQPPCGKETIYWSLSLEEQFYVLFPLLLYFVGSARLRWILGAAILIQFPLHREAPEMLWLTRTDSISYGVLIAIAAARGNLQAVQAAVDRHPVWARCLGVLLVAAVAGLSLVPQLRIEVGLIALASAALVLLASGDRGVIIPRSNALRAVFLWTGSRSFGIYLVHHLCFWAAREIFYRLYHGAHFDNSVALGLTGLGLTVLTAEVSYRLLETPIREYGHRLASVYTQKTDRAGSAMKTIGTVARGLWPVLALLVCTRAFADLPSAETAYTQGDFTKAFHDFRELAEIGSPIAQLDLAIMYARGERTRPSDIYAYAWASLAADNGSEKAQALAEQLRPGLAPGSEKIATDIPNEFGNAELDARLNPKIVENAEQEELSALLATTPVANGGDPKRAMSLIDDVFKGVKDDPTAHEIRAAAQANMGDFVGAMASEKEAVKKADSLKWDLTPLNERLAAYEAQQPWTGTLLTF